MFIIVYKSEKLLEVWEGGGLRGSYPIGIGKVEVGHKENEGDGRTPEGDYMICVKNPKSKFFLSLGLNYPNNIDAAVGLRKGLISREEYEAIVEANDRGDIPLWKTRLGGEIYIHGGLEDQPWTEGCIRMNNADIQYLFYALSVGTHVFIKP